MRLLTLALLLFSGLAVAQPKSGIEFASEEIRKLQASDAENPGMLWVDQGSRLWTQQCASCHKDAASMKGVAARYPRVIDNRVVTIEVKIREKVRYAYESEELLALTAFVAHQSRGLPLRMETSEKDIVQGKAQYFRRRGQMNLSCAHCHDANPGKRLGAETLTQGHGNGYPSYRLEWQKVGSLQRRLRACMFGLHAELPAYGSEELLQLELYLAHRGRGLPVETPAVRR